MVIRGALVGGATFATVLAVSLAAASAAEATPSSSLYTRNCPQLSGRKWQVPNGSKTGTKYTMSLWGSAFSCSAAAKWVEKLINDPATSLIGIAVPLKNGPTGYKCSTTPDKEHYAYSGTCTKGPTVHPIAGFAWGGATA